MKVMVIAESVDLAAETCHIVVGAGHHAAAFCDGAESLGEFVHAILAARPNVVLFDIGHIGVDAAELVAALADTSDPPAVVLCTDTAPTVIRVTDGVVAGVLKKPFTPEMLLEFLDAVEVQHVKSSGVRARPSPRQGSRRGA